ncbi:MAG: HD-GYP domain-containing protein, partial [Ilumatobacteraceae bacterium]
MITTKVQPETSEQRWQHRPGAARLLRWAIRLVPFFSATGVAIALSLVLPPPDGFLMTAGRLVLVAGAATVTMRLVERAMRRALPLASLLELTLIFPDQAPSRLKMAMRAASSTELSELLDRYQRTGAHEPAAAAERLLELVGALSRHDRITRGHSERVRAYAQMIGEELGFTGEQLDKLRWAALIHDIGKLHIDAKILNKPGALTKEELQIIKSHPERGAELAAPLAGWLGDSVLAVVEHHEKWDGTGYPRGLSGHSISQVARIVAVADVFDVMTSARSYKAPRPAAEARAELARCAGTHFDPVVVRAFLAISVGRLRKVMGPLSWLAASPLLARPALASSNVSGSGTGATASGSAGATAGAGGAVGGAASGAVAGGFSAASATVTATATAVSATASTGILAGLGGSLVSTA